MTERNVCLMEIKADMEEKLREERNNNRDKYMETVKDLILQAMIKLLEDKLLILCREEDKDEIKSSIDELQSKFHDFMVEKTGREEYNCELEVIEGKNLTDEQDRGCGGIILYTVNNRIVCPNTLLNRLDLAFEEYLPQIRKTLFPKA